MLIPHNFVGAACDIFRMNDNIVASGNLEKITDDYVIVTDKNENLTAIKPQTMVKVSIHPEDNQGDTFVGLVADSSSGFIKVGKIQRFSDFDKREYFRLNVMLNSRIQLRNSKGELTDTIIPIKVRDLSLRGIFFVAKDNMLLPGQEFDVLRPLSEIYNYTCTIRRKVDYYRSIGYGCSFGVLNNKQEDCLCRFLFEQQRKEILRAKNQKL